MPFNQMHLLQYFEKHKDVTKHISMSDSEALNMADLIAGADSESKSMWNNLKLNYTGEHNHSKKIDWLATQHHYNTHCHLWNYRNALIWNTMLDSIYARLVNPTMLSRPVKV